MPAPDPYWPNGNGPNGFIGFNIRGAGSAAVETMDYSMSLADGSPQAGMYHAVQQSFETGDPYYSGLQPHDNDTAAALFSVFGNGSRPDHRNCYESADGGSGTSCFTNIPYNSSGPRQTYHFSIWLDESNETENRWAATVRNESTDEVHEVGAWWLAKSRGLLSPEIDGFVERFGKIKSCGELSPTDTVISNVKFGTTGADEGEAATYGNCEKNVQMTYDYDVTTGSLHIKSEQGSPTPLTDGTPPGSMPDTDSVDAQTEHRVQSSALQWRRGVQYLVGDEVAYEGVGYTCLQEHTAHAANWTPPNSPALWRPIR